MRVAAVVRDCSCRYVDSGYAGDQDGAPERALAAVFHPMPQFVTGREALARRDGIAVHRDDRAVSLPDDIGLAASERLIEDDRLAVKCDGFDLELARLFDAEFLKQLVGRLLGRISDCPPAASPRPERRVARASEDGFRYPHQ